MLKIKKWFEILDNSPQYLFLASGHKKGEGFLIVGVKNCDENILDDKKLLDCHRKELIGNESAKAILFAINLNINNLLNELKKSLCNKRRLESYFLRKNKFNCFITRKKLIYIVDYQISRVQKH